MKLLTMNSLTLLTLLLATTGAYAHPGHGLLENWAHVLEPEHVLPVLVIIALLIYAVIKRKSRR